MSNLITPLFDVIGKWYPIVIASPLALLAIRAVVKLLTERKSLHLRRSNDDLIKFRKLSEQFLEHCAVWEDKLFRQNETDQWPASFRSITSQMRVLTQDKEFKQAIDGLNIHVDNLLYAKNLPMEQVRSNESIVMKYMYQIKHAIERDYRR